MAASKSLLPILLVLFFNYFVKLHASVPVLVWSKESVLSERKQVLAGHTVSANDFKENFLNKIISSSKTICVFIQDRLSVDDISRYGDAYSAGGHSAALHNLRTAVETANSSFVLQSVASPTSGLVDFIRNSVNGKVIELQKADSKSVESIRSQELDPSKTNVFIIHLKPTSKGSVDTAADMLSANDMIIGKVLKELNSLGTPYTCVLTADLPSQHVEEKQLQSEMSTVAHDRLRRDIEADVTSSMTREVTNGTLVWTDCILLYFKEVSFTKDKSNMTARSVANVTENGLCNKTIQVIEFTVQNGSETAEFKLKFVKSGSSWMCKDIELNAEPGGNVNISCMKIQARQNTAFSCQDARFRYFKRISEKNETETILKFSGFQVEAFTNTTAQKFHEAYDCVGFFTIPIFMGLVTVGVLLTILFGGIIATMSITTMDRFDDPKGPGIQIGSSN